MPPARAELLHESRRFLAARRPGRALALLARVPVPVLATNWFASRSPSPAPDRDDAASPFVAAIEPVLATGAGVLDGEHVVVKDALDLAGHRTSLGLSDGGDEASEDAELVRRVRAAGGVVVGKGKMTELGMDGLGALMHHPMPRNPRARGYFPGGSSTGTAVAVAAGLARYGVGADGLGSVRIPAALCGLVGLKTTAGRLPSAGFQSPAPTMDVAGPIARTALDCARLWSVLAGEPAAALEPRAPAEVGVARQLGPELASRSIQRAFARALTALGARVRRVDVPGADRCTFLGGMIGAHEVSQTAWATRATSPAGRMNVALGRSFSPRDVEQLRAQRQRLRDALARALDATSILAMPTTAVPAPALSSTLLAGDQDLVLMRALGAYTPLANLAGVPSIAVPCGVDERGRPLSIMFVGPEGSETQLLELALAIERTGLGTRPL